MCRDARWREEMKARKLRRTIGRIDWDKEIGGVDKRKANDARSGGCH